MNNKRLILARESKIKYSKGILDVLGKQKRKLTTSLGLTTIISSMLFTSGCSKSVKIHPYYDIKSRLSETKRETLSEEQLEEFDPNKCEIEGEHYHLCTWTEKRDSDGGTDIIFKFCKDEEIEKLKSEKSDFEITKYYRVPILNENDIKEIRSSITKK